MLRNSILIKEGEISLFIWIFGQISIYKLVFEIELDQNIISSQ